MERAKIIIVWPLSEKSCLSKVISFIHLILIFQNLIYTIVLTRAQLDTLSREELAEELIKCSNISDQLKIVTDQFDDFVSKYNKLQSELVISKNCSFSLVNWIINLERDVLSNGQYIKRKMLEKSCSSFNVYFLIRKLFFCLSLNFLKIILEIKLRFS